MERTYISNTKIEKSDFYKNKKVFKIDEIIVDKILVSKKEPYGTNKSVKYFNGYNDDDVIKDHYVQNVKWLDMLNALIVIRQCISRLLIKSC